MKYTVETKFSMDDQHIQQDVYTEHNEIKTRMWTNLVNLQDQGIYDALVDMGWTPPQQSKAKEE